MLYSFKLFQPKRGQAVVEYAGAIIIAVVLMAAVLLVLPDDVYAFFVAMQEQVLEFLASQVEDL